MGGHLSGQHASQRAIEAIADYIKRWRQEEDFSWLLILHLEKRSEIMWLQRFALPMYVSITKHKR